MKSPNYVRTVNIVLPLPMVLFHYLTCPDYQVREQLDEQSIERQQLQSSHESAI
jgi:hypothetical protein